MITQPSIVRIIEPRRNDADDSSHLTVSYGSAIRFTARVLRATLCLAVTLLLNGCTTTGPHTSPSAALGQLTDEYLQHKFAVSPLEAVALGLHEYDGRFGDYSRSAIDNQVARLREFQSHLKAFPEAKLTPEARLDLNLLRHDADKTLWAIERARMPFNNPMTYAGALDISIYIKRDFAPLKDRVRYMTRILDHAPEVFGAARANLDPVLPKPFVETAISVAEGTASFLEKDVANEVAKVADLPVKAGFEGANARAVKELRGFADWLRTERLAAANQQFAIGKAAFAEMLRAERIDLDPQQVLEIGLRELAAEERRFEEAGRIIDPTRPAPEVFRAIQKDHPTEHSLLPDTRKNLEVIRSFVVKNDLVGSPSEVRARVEATLPPFRATSFASMETPGPYETRATDAYYYVTPTEPDWTPAQKDEWLTAFNYYTTDVVSIHEAYPGHYVQFLALNASKASRVAKVVTSYSFVEGWAHYTEQMVLDAGFGGPGTPDPVRTAKYRMAQSDEALLRLCRLCASIQLHCLGASVDDATRFFMEHCHYAEKPARQEAVRGTFDPGYCFYTLGKLQILKLREDYRAQEGAGYSPRKFHDELLRRGAPPIQLLREQLIKDPTRWGQTL